MAIKQAHTGFRSLPYRSGSLYNWLTSCLYDQDKKFVTIAKLIGDGSKSVMDLPCGTGKLAKFLHPNTTYIGYDLNHRFLKKIVNDFQKGKINLRKVILKQYNIFDFDKYPKEEQDVIVFCDILHHVYNKSNNKHIELVENAKEHAKRIIICEPITINPEDINGNNFLGRWTLRVSKHLPDKVIKYLDFFLADNDGINSYEHRSGWKHNEASLKNLYNKLGFQKMYDLTDECIGVWER